MTARVLVTGVSLFTVPIALEYLGKELFGVYAALSSLLVLLACVDFGLGAGTTLLVSSGLAQNDQLLIERAVSAAFFILTAISLSICAAVALNEPALHFFVPLAKSSPLFDKANAATRVFVFVLLLNLPISLVTRIQAGMQKTAQAQLWQSAAALIGAAGLVSAITLHSSFTIIVLTAAAAPLLANTLNWIWCIKTWSIFPLPGRTTIHTTTAQLLVGTGGVMALQQVSGLLAWAIDPFLLSRIAGSEEAAQYAVVSKLFTVGMLAQFVALPLWSACADATNRNDQTWIEKTIRRILLITLGFQLAYVIPMVLWGHTLVHLWVGPSIDPSFTLLTGFAIWVLLAGFASTMNSCLNVGATLRPHVVLLAATASMSTILKASYCSELGAEGAVWISNFCFAGLYVIPALLLARRQSTHRNKATGQDPN